MKKKVIYSIIIVSVIIILSVAVTYAVYTFSGVVNISGTSECFDVNYVKGQDIGSDSNSRTLMVSDDYTGGLFASVIVSIDNNCTIDNGIGTLYLNTDTTTSSILLTSGALKYQVIENSLTKPASGTITSTGKVAIYENIEVNNTPKQLSVSVWLDSSMITDSNRDEILSSVYKGSISMKVESGDK